MPGEVGKFNAFRRARICAPGVGCTSIRVRTISSKKKWLFTMINFDVVDMMVFGEKMGGKNGGKNGSQVDVGVGGVEVEVGDTLSNDHKINLINLRFLLKNLFSGL